MPVLRRLFPNCGARTPNGRLRGHQDPQRGAILCPRRRSLGRRPHSAGSHFPASLVLSLLVVLGLGAVQAAPPVTAPAPVPATTASAPVPATTAPAAIPNYGGRDSGAPALDTEAPNPAASAARAVEALVIVLVGVVGVVYALKRFGLVKPGVNGQPAKISLTGKFAGTASRAAAESPVTVVSSQTLPGGAMLHVVRVDDRNLLLGATPQTVTHLAEWPAGLGEAEDNSDFEDYLTRADDSPNSGIAAANARLRSLLSHPDSEE